MAERLRLYGIAAAAGIAALLPLLGYNLLAYERPFRLGYDGGRRVRRYETGTVKLDWQAAGYVVDAPVLNARPVRLFSLLRHRWS